MMPIRRATPADVPAMARAMAAAYEHDVLMSWIVPDEAARAERLRRFFAASMHRIVRSGAREVYTLDGGGAEATWAPPGKHLVPSLQMLPAVPGMLAAVGARGMRRSNAFYRALTAVHPTAPHWYLEGLSTDPPLQGRGLASALISPVLERCDGGGLDAYLETQNPANVAFYERFGFAVTGEVVVPRGGPRMYLMTRRPR